MDDLSGTVPVEVIATWPVGSFVENLALRRDGRFAVSIHNKREIHIVGRDGACDAVIAMPASPAGLVVAGDDLFAVAGEPGVGPHHIYRVSPGGAVMPWVRVTDSLFLNGFTPGLPGRAWAVDSLRGAIFEIDLEARVARQVASDERLGKATPDPMFPGVNGIKRDDDALFLTNTERRLVLRAPLGPDGPTGALEILAEDLLGDDLALDASGDLYVTNHIRNTLTRLGRDGSRTIVAGPAQHMAGCTACAFGPAGDDSLYVTTTGGMVLPLDGIVREAKLVRLRLGVAGRPVLFEPRGRT